ncbi:MAG: sigma-70 family RNA polymerase sigma factor [Anaeromyxobacteraceae bacterium]
MAPSDLELVERARGGDPDAFRDLVVRHQRRVYAVALGIVKDRDQAWDVSQDAFVRVHQHLAEFRDESSFSTWLHRITARLAIDALRKERPARRNDVADVPEAVLREAAPGVLGTALGTDPQETVLRRELSARMTEALGQLPDLHRSILVLREMDGLSYEELAERLSIPKGTVMSRLFHARKKMQALLAGYAGIDAPASGDVP